MLEWASTFLRKLCLRPTCAATLVIALAMVGTPPVFADAPPVPPTKPRVAKPQVLPAADLKLAKKAVQAAERRQWKTAIKHARRAKNPLPTKLVLWLYYRDRGTGATFDEISAFMASSPNWPDQEALQRNAEAAMTDEVSDQSAIAWFTEHPPASWQGHIRLAEALIRVGPKETGIGWLRYSWINDDFPRKKRRAIYRRNKQHLRQADHVARLDRLLWGGRQTDARAMLSVVPTGYKRLAEARLALMALAPTVDSRIARVPASLLDHPGLVYERARWRRRKGLDEGAQVMLRRSSGTHGPRPEKWWTERRIQVRKLLAKGHISEAFGLARGHGREPGGASYAEAEWLAGWIALRFLRDKKVALAHFRRLYGAVRYPVSRARGAYWIGRAATGLGYAKMAREWYRKAARHGTTYYGQLAYEALADRSVLSLPPEPEPTEIQRVAFNHREVVRATRVLAELDEFKFFKTIVLHMGKHAKTPVEHVLVGRLAESFGRPDLTVRAGKLATKHGIQNTILGYPLVAMPSRRPEKALLLAVARQESEFNPRAVSSAGAKGLMQLMPATAREVARSLKIPYRSKRLVTDPSYNVRLGSAYFQRLIEAYDGSYVLAIAAYNGGPTRVKRWIRRHGDPRTAEVDAIDWIELIPIAETRNYVQRVLEGVQVYRHRLADTPVTSRLSADLDRRTN